MIGRFDLCCRAADDKIQKNQQSKNGEFVFVHDFLLLLLWYIYFSDLIHIASPSGYRILKTGGLNACAAYMDNNS